MHLHVNNTYSFFFFLIVYNQACAIVQLFVGFEIFKIIFQEKKQSTPAKRDHFISETVKSGNITKNKQAKVQIIAGILHCRTLLQANYRQVGNHH